MVLIYKLCCGGKEKGLCHFLFDTTPSLIAFVVESGLQIMTIPQSLR